MIIVFSVLISNIKYSQGKSNDKPMVAQLLMAEPGSPWLSSGDLLGFLEQSLNTDSDKSTLWVP